MANKIEDAMQTVTEITAESFEQQVLHAPVPVLVDFYAPWCGPCKMLHPVLDSLAAEFAGRVKVLKVNVDEAPALAAQFDIAAVPTLLLFRDGEAVDLVEGLAPLKALRAKLEAVAAPAEPASSPKASCFT